MDIAHRVKMNEPLEELLAGCIRGDRICQKELYQKYYGKMMAVCYRYTNNREDARDIFHIGIMKVFKNLHNYQPSSSLDSWIRRIMINTAIDHYRKHKKHNNETDLEYASNTPMNSHIVEQMSADEILKLVQRLSPGYRAVFNLYVIDGFTHKEIGEKLNISEGTSKSNLSKARAKLQTWICEEHDATHRLRRTKEER